MNRLIFSIFALLVTNICNAGTYTITPKIDFGMVALGFDLQPEVTISNTGVTALQLGAIATTNTVANPFGVIDTGCANSIIQPGEKCSFMVLFSPDSINKYTDSFNVEIVSEGVSSVVSLSGEGVAPQAAPDIQVSFSSVNFGTVDVLESTDASYTFPPAGSIIPVILIKNIGSSGLDISSVNVTGQDSSEVTFQGDCVAVITPGGTCGILIEFKPINPGIKDAAISILSNDPDESAFDIIIRGTAVGEDDGVPAGIEDAGPNNGDGNNDGIQDSKQSNVSTLVDTSGTYVTYVTDETFRFSNMSVLQQVEAPPDFVIGSGIFDFTVQGLGVGQTIEVGVILPAGVKPSAYYMYAPTTDISARHWFNFDFDGKTGAFVLGDATFTTLSGAKFTRSLVRVILKDGGRGDTDLTENGIITVTSAIPISSDEGSASMSFLQLLCLIFILFITRYSKYTRLSFRKLF